MNERIRELAKQAFEYAQNMAESTRPGPTKPQLMTSSELKEIYNQKFAELIVRECAKRSKELGQLEIGLGILKHFGVEE